MRSNLSQLPINIFQAIARKIIAPIGAFNGVPNMRLKFEYYKAVRRIYGMTASQAVKHMRKMHAMRDMKAYVNLHYASGSAA